MIIIRQSLVLKEKWMSMLDESSCIYHPHFFKENM